MKPFTIWIDPIPRYASGLYLIMCRRNNSIFGFQFTNVIKDSVCTDKSIADKNRRFNFGVFTAADWQTDTRAKWTYYLIT